MSEFAVPGLGWAKKPAFQLGKGKTLEIPMELHAAARLKLLQLLNKRGVDTGIVLLEGGNDRNQYDTDTEMVFR